MKQFLVRVVFMFLAVVGGIGAARAAEPSCGAGPVFAGSVGAASTLQGYCDLYLPFGYSSSTAFNGGCWISPDGASFLFDVGVRDACTPISSTPGGGTSTGTPTASGTGGTMTLAWDDGKSAERIQDMALMWALFLGAAVVIVCIRKFANLWDSTPHES